MTTIVLWDQHTDGTLFYAVIHNGVHSATDLGEIYTMEWLLTHKYDEPMPEVGSPEDIDEYDRRYPSATPVYDDYATFN